MALSGFGKILSAGFNNYKNHFKLFTKIALLLVLLPNIIFGTLSVYFSINTPLNLLTGKIISLVGNSVTSLASLLFTITIIKVLAHKRKKKTELTAVKAVSHGLKHFISAIFVQIIFFLIIGIPLFPIFLLRSSRTIFTLLYLLAWFIYALYITIYFTFVYYALVTDGCSVIDSFRHSRKVVMKRWWRVLGFMLLAGLIIIGIFSVILLTTSLLVGIVLFLFNSISNILTIITMFTVIVISVLQMFSMPFTLAFMEELYLDLKKNTKGVK